MLYYMIKGGGNIKIEGKNYRFGDGDIIFLNPQEMFCCRIDSNIYHERIVLHLNEDILEGFPKECGKLLSPFTNHKKGENNCINAKTVSKYRLDLIIRDIFILSKRAGSHNEVLTLCKTAELLGCLCEIFESKNDTDLIKSTDHPTVNRILEYLNGNYTKQLTVDIIAREFNLDKSYMSHLFKEHVGISLWNYVIFRRISYFNSLIKNGLTIDEASHRAGFNNYSNFFRLYKKHTGITPMEYKKSP